jgi:hypothetical protein
MILSMIMMMDLEHSKQCYLRSMIMIMMMMIMVMMMSVVMVLVICSCAGPYGGG